VIPKQVSFSIGMGPITWLIAAEMLPSRARAKGMTLCCFVNRLVSGGVALTALSTCDALGFTGFFALCKLHAINEYGDYCIARSKMTYGWCYPPLPI
jgi:hypothetical protein